jgi:hypothetical protein
MSWPVVYEKDAGRPAGAPDECFVCRRKIGQRHVVGCAIGKFRYEQELADRRAELAAAEAAAIAADQPKEDSRSPCCDCGKNTLDEDMVHDRCPKCFKKWHRKGHPELYEGRGKPGLPVVRVSEEEYVESVNRRCHTEPVGSNTTIVTLPIGRWNDAD